jgi:hypothetical protein
MIRLFWLAWGRLGSKTWQRQDPESETWSDESPASETWTTQYAETVTWE